MSDRRLKENIVRIGTLPLAAGLYLYNYRAGLTQHPSQERQLGVMADEIEHILPQAVTLSGNKYKQVDYALLDISPADVIAAFNQ